MVAAGAGGIVGTTAGGEGGCVGALVGAFVPPQAASNIKSTKKKSK